MAENDIYNSSQQWLTIVKKINDGTYCFKNQKGRQFKTGKYFIKNKDNIKYFKKLINKLEFIDCSFIRRIGLIKQLRKITTHTDKDLKDINRDDVERIVVELQNTHKTINTKRDFVNSNKYIWKLLFPETDSKGRADDSVVPYPWRIKVRQDKSLQKDKKDKFDDTDYFRLQKSLSKDTRMQLYFSMLYNNLARPQELCYIDLKDIELFDNYARVRISKHGKEGTKTLQLVDNFYYLSQWLNIHPQWPHNKEAPLFITLGRNSNGKRLNPAHANKILKIKIKQLGINKAITNYSFKRNGVTHKYLSGESAQSIQKTAGWTSTQQLKTYDMSTQEEYLKEELIKKGIVNEKTAKKRFVTYKHCAFCNSIEPITNTFCTKCRRPLDREDIIKKENERDDTIQKLKTRMEEAEDMIEMMKNGWIKQEK